MTVKSQQVRLMDTFFLGPFMIYAASLIPEKHSVTKNVLVISGIMTAMFNYFNYTQVNRALAGK